MNKQEEKGFVVGVGEPIKVYCNGCLTEYEILHEPFYRTAEMRKQFGGKAKPAKYCPFCGSDDNEDLEVRG